MDLARSRASLRHECYNCGIAKRALSICPCERAYYCTVACQREHWPAHKAQCQHGRAKQTPATACTNCGAVSRENQWCQCGTVLYCSIKCQRAHWDARHVNDCQPFYKHRVEEEAKEDTGAAQSKFLQLVNNLRAEI